MGDPSFTRRFVTAYIATLAATGVLAFYVADRILRRILGY
jgi:hypothetical protein